MYKGENYYNNDYALENDVYGNYRMKIMIIMMVMCSHETDRDSDNSTWVLSLISLHQQANSLCGKNKQLSIRIIMMWMCSHDTEDEAEDNSSQMVSPIL